ncbi:MAG: hypothetical protein ACLS5G_00890 [Streptococcus sp.]
MMLKLMMLPHIKAYDNLKSGKSKAMVLSGSYASLLESVDSNYAQI